MSGSTPKISLIRARTAGILVAPPTGSTSEMPSGLTPAAATTSVIFSAISSSRIALLETNSARLTSTRSVSPAACSATVVRSRAVRSCLARAARSSQSCETCVTSSMVSASGSLMSRPCAASNRSAK